MIICRQNTRLTVYDKRKKKKERAKKPTWVVQGQWRMGWARHNILMGPTSSFGSILFKWVKMKKGKKGRAWSSRESHVLDSPICVLLSPFALYIRHLSSITMTHTLVHSFIFVSVSIFPNYSRHAFFTISHLVMTHDMILLLNKLFFFLLKVAQ